MKDSLRIQMNGQVAMNYMMDLPWQRWSPHQEQPAMNAKSSWQEQPAMNAKSSWQEQPAMNAKSSWQEQPAAMNAKSSWQETARNECEVLMTGTECEVLTTGTSRKQCEETEKEHEKSTNLYAYSAENHAETVERAWEEHKLIRIQCREPCWWIWQGFVE